MTTPPYKIRLEISYDGTDFLGWQRLKPGTLTIQGALESGLSRIFNTQVSVVGSGRTDAGVHAVAQTAHFQIHEIPKMKDFIYAINCQLPASIRVQNAWVAPPQFHSIRDAKSKTYKYRILNRPRPSALKVRYTHWVRAPLSVKKLNELSQALLGEHDFKSFQSAGSETKTSRRRILEAKWSRRPGNVLEFTITGSGFLKQMVRNIVGTVVELSQANGTPEDLQKVLAACDRKKAGPTAPPQGLYLFRVQYSRELDSKCRKL